MNYLMVLEASTLFIFGFGALALGALSLLKTKLKGPSIALSFAGIASIVFLFIRWSEVTEFWELVKIAVLIVGGGAIGGGIIAICALLIKTRSK
jgi:hypothetical protein